MLNERLHAALTRLFGEVGITNEGQEADIIPAPGQACQWTVPSGGQAGARGEQYHVDCPFCGDRRKRLYISYLSLASPVVRGVQLAKGPLRAFCQNEHCLADRANKDRLRGMLEAALEGQDASAFGQVGAAGQSGDDESASSYSQEITVDGIRTWVPGYEPIGQGTAPEVLTYLASRRITMAEVQWMRIGAGPIVTPSGRTLKGGCPWVMFPVIQNGVLRGLQARCLPCYMDEGDKMKYWFHPSCRKASVLYNVDAAREIGACVISEGVFDVASIGKAGVCCFGHTPSPLQKTLIAGAVDCVIWLPDMDGGNAQCNPLKTAEDTAAKWNSQGAFLHGAHVVRLSGKDAGEMTRQQVWDEILAQVPEATASYLVSSVLPKL